MNFPFRVFLLVGLLLGGLSGSLFSADNLLSNGGFEEEKNENIPLGWSNSIDGQRDLADMYVRDGKEGVDTHTGTHAVQLKVSTKGGFAGTGRKPRNVWESVRAGKNETTPSIAIQPGKTYRLSFWVKREGFTDPTHLFSAEARGLPFPAAGDTYFPLGVSERLGNDCDWERQEVLLTVPPDSIAGELQLTFRIQFADNLPEGVPSPIAYVDDVVLTEEN